MNMLVNGNVGKHIYSIQHKCFSCSFGSQWAAGLHEVLPSICSYNTHILLWFCHGRLHTKYDQNTSKGWTFLQTPLHVNFTENPLARLPAVLRDILAEEPGPLCAHHRGEFFLLDFEWVSPWVSPFKTPFRNMLLDFFRRIAMVDYSLRVGFLRVVIHRKTAQMARNHRLYYCIAISPIPSFNFKFSSLVSTFYRKPLERLNCSFSLFR